MPSGIFCPRCGDVFEFWDEDSRDVFMSGCGSIRALEESGG